MTRALRGCAALPVVFVLGACGTPPAQDYGGSWMPVNRFQDTPAEIPLSPAYTFYATPIDATLKTMLERWATDTGLKLSFRLGSDFALYKPVGRIRTTDLQAAASELSAVYAAQGVSVTADSKQILVQPASDTHVDPVPTNDRGDPCQTGPC
jgi:hypothetical protein